MIYVVIFLLNVADLITTHIGVNIMGFYELNPVMRPIIGSWVIIPVKLGIAALVCYGFYHVRTKFPKFKLAKYATWGVVVFYSLVVLLNGLQLFLGK